MLGSEPPRAAMAIMLLSLVKAAPRFASSAAFWRFVVSHLLCPDINYSPFARNCFYYTTIYDVFVIQ